MKKQMRTARLAAAALCLAALGGACAGPRPPRAGPGGERYVEEGIASWYGEDFHGRPTASGERYDMYAISAAHRTLPLGTWVRVTRLDRGDSPLEVRVNDRGPFVKGRIIDLSYAAARRLGFAEAGTVAVRLEASLPAPPPGQRPGGFLTVQVGAFAVESNALRLRDRLRAAGRDAFVVRFEDNRGVWHRVRVGRHATDEEARRAATALEREGLPGFVVRQD